MAKGEIISCVACGHDVAKSAKACPNCGAKPSKPLGKTFNGKLLKWIIILYIFIGVDFIVFERAMPNPNSGGAESSSTENSTTTEDTTSSDTTGVLDTTQPVTDTGVTNTDGGGVTGTDGGGVTGTEGTQTDVPVTDATDATNTDATQPTDTTQTTTP